MSDIIQTAVAALAEKLDGNPFEGSARFDIEGEGSVRIEGETAEASDAEADVVFRAEADTFRGILEGDVKPTAAFMSGELQIEGDMGLAMALAQTLS